MSTRELPPLWRRRRKLGFDVTALLLFTLTVVLVPPWTLFARAADVPDSTVEPELYAGGFVDLGLEGLGLAHGGGLGGAVVDRRTTPSQKRSSFAREEQNGVVRPQNVDWGDSWMHHLSAGLIFKEGDEEEKRRRELKTRSADDNGEGDQDDVRMEIRQSRSKTIHLTFNTCLQPSVNSSANEEPKIPPPLLMYVSNTTSNKSPGPNVQGKAQIVVEVDRGFGSLDFIATGGVWVGIYAPVMPPSQKGFWDDKPWNYELSLSTDEPYHGFRDDQFLYLVDTDDSTALLITGNMTADASKDGGVDERVTIDGPPPYTMYAQSRNVTSRFKGLEKSYCAVRMLAQIRPANTDVSLTTRGLGNLLKQQFHLKELNSSSGYFGYLARPRTKTPDDTSGILWKPLALNTKKDGNCQIIYNLPFCSEVAYAVPSNPTVFGNLDDLTSFYDESAKGWWDNFAYSLQQIQCNATNSAKYSLVRGCDDCAAAYKNWLCAVTIPRCMDYSSDLPYLAERSSNKLFWNATVQGWQKHPRMPTLNKNEIDKFVEAGGWLANGNRSMSKVPSRNKKIDEIVKPGAYKEIRPCKDLCWTLVQSCPSPLGFSCPRDGTWGKEMSYGERDEQGDVTCSYLGAVYSLNSAVGMVPGVVLVWAAVLLAVGWAL